MPLATVCTRHGAPVLVPAGERCPACPRGGRGRVRRGQRNVERGRNSANWRRTSKRRIALAGGLCEIGLPGCTGRATTSDLIGGGDHSRARLADTRAACLHCHGKVDGGRR